MFYDIYVSGIFEKTVYDINEALNYINSNNLIILNTYKWSNGVKVYCEEVE